jgi:hypothetical protein
MLMPVSDMSMPMMPMVPQSWRPGSIGSKIHILADRPDRPAVDHSAVSEVRATANRGWLRKCEGICDHECGRENDCFEFHCSVPFSFEKENEG